MTELDILQQRLSNRAVENEPMARHTTFKIGGPATYFFDAKSKEDITCAVNVAEQLRIPYLMVSLGSNMLVSDAGFDGLVIKTSARATKAEGNLLYAEVGLSMAQLVALGQAAGLTGMEFAATIPGGVGGGVRGNAGCYGKEVGSFVHSVECIEGGQIKTLSKKECEFAYRESRFKKHGGVVLAATFALEYGDVAASRTQVVELMKKRAAAQPVEFSSVGCIFKNLEINPTHPPLMIRGGEGGVNIPSEFLSKGIIPTAWIIDHVLGMKGVQVGKAQISEKHGNFIINLGGATATDVMTLVKKVQHGAREKMGVELQAEIELVGF